MLLQVLLLLPALISKLSAEGRTVLFYRCAISCLFMQEAEALT